MRFRWTWLFLLLALLRPAARAQTITPNAGFQIPAFQQTNWQVPINYNFNLLDGMLGGISNLPIGTATPSITSASNWRTQNTGSTTITNFVNGFPGQSIQIFCGPSDTVTSIVNSATIALNSTFSCSTAMSIRLTLVGTVWTEVGRGAAGGTSGRGGLAWSNAISYEIGDIVSAGGYAWISLANSNLNNIPASSPASWQILPSPYASAWSGTLTYNAGDLVSYMGTVYVSVAGANLNHVPTLTMYWSPAAASSACGSDTQIQYNNAGTCGAVDISSYSNSTHGLSLISHAIDQTPFSVLGLGATQTHSLVDYNNTGSPSACTEGIACYRGNGIGPDANAIYVHLNDLEPNYLYAENDMSPPNSFTNFGMNASGDAFWYNTVNAGAVGSVSGMNGTTGMFEFGGCVATCGSGFNVTYLDNIGITDNRTAKVPDADTVWPVPITATADKCLTGLNGTTGVYTSAYCDATTHLLISNTAPTISSGFGTGASVTDNNGTAAFRINVGTSNTGNGVIGLPTATTGWNCFATDITTTSTTVSQTKTTGSTTATATLQNYTDISGTGAWTDNDVLAVICFAY